MASTACLLTGFEVEEEEPVIACERRKSGHETAAEQARDKLSQQPNSLPNHYHPLDPRVQYRSFPAMKGLTKAVMRWVLPPDFCPMY